MTDKSAGKAPPEEPNIPPGSAALLAAAIAQDRIKDDPVASSRAEIFLDEQTNFIRLQTAQLNEQRRLLLGSLRYRHAGELMAVTLQVMLGVVGLAVVLALGGAIWSATHDNGLIIEAFDVPPDLVTQGHTGKEVASQLQDQLAVLQDQTDAARAADTYTNNWGDDIKVEIPDTGISIGELNRYLREWLGHETHIKGDVYHAPGGGVVVTARAGSAAGQTFEGAETDLGKLMQRAAEDVYARTQPYRYSVLLFDRKDYRGSIVVLEKLLNDGPPSELKWAQVGLAYDSFSLDNPPDAETDARKALERDTDFGLAYDVLSLAQWAQGHDEDALASMTRGAPLLADNPKKDLTPRATAMLETMMRARLDEERGDFSAAARENATASELPDFDGHAKQATIALAADLALAHDAAGAATTLATLGHEPGVTENSYFIRAGLANLVALSKWQAATEFTSTMFANLKQWTHPAFSTATQTGQSSAAYSDMSLALSRMSAAVHVIGFLPCRLRPLTALAAAHTGAMASALAQIGRTPTDCYLAVRTRGKIDALEKKWDAAAYWFAMAAKEAPSLPFAYTDWGEMLLAKGDAAGAIKEFAVAHDKGPHFADPLKMWGDALMLQHRSDLAAAKFEEANACAPNWARLHLKWAEALAYSGHRKEANEQYAIASRLGLTADKKPDRARDSRD